MNIQSLRDHITVNSLFKALFILILVLLAVIAVDILFFGSSLHNSSYGVTDARGSSMNPVFDSGCSLVFYNTYEGNSELSVGQTVTYTPINSDNAVTHNIIKKYESYNPKTANHKIINNKSYIQADSFKYYNSEGEVKMKPTLASQERTQELKGKTVYIMKGVGNDSIDPDLVTQKQIKAIVYTNTYIELSDTDSVCKGKNLHKLNIKLHY